LAAIGLLLLVRVNLPWILRRVVVSQASQLLKADVSLGDVDLALYKGGFALIDLAIRLPPTEQMPPTAHGAKAPVTAASPPLPAQARSATAPAEGSPIAEGTAHAEPPHGETADSRTTRNSSPPVLAWKRLEVSLRWLPLFHKTIQLREIVLDAPRILLERLKSGEFNFEALARVALQPGEAPPPPTAAPSPTPAAGEAASGWLVGVDRVAVSGGKLRFRDYTLKGSAPIDIAIPNVEVHDISLSPKVYGKPSESRVRVMLGEGSIEASARASLSGAAVTLHTDLQARGLPLRHARLYVPGVGWSELTGKLDADVKYGLETGKTNEVRGSVSLSDLAVGVPELARDALALRRVTVGVEPIDLLNRVATITEVSLDGAWVVTRPSETLLPLVLAAQPGSKGKPQPPAGKPGEEPPRPGAAAEPTTPADAGEQSAAPEAERQRAEEGRPGEPGQQERSAEAEAGNQAASRHEPKPVAQQERKTPASPWRWSVKTVRIADSGVQVLSDDRALDVHLNGETSDLAPGIETRAPVDITIGAGDGALHIKGQARISPPGFAGEVVVTALSLPELISISGLVPENPLQSAKLDTQLAIEAGMAKQNGPELARGDLRVSGKIGLSDAHVVSGGTDAAVAGVELQVATMTFAGALPGPASAADAGPQTTSQKGSLSFRGDLAVHEVNTTLANLNDFQVKISSLGLTGTAIDVPGLLAETAAEVPAPDAGDVRLKTRLVLAEPQLAVGDGKDFLVTLKSLELGLSEVDAPGVLAPAPQPPGKPIRIAANNLMVEQPRIRLTLTSNGMVLPGPGVARTTSGAPPPAAGGATSPPSVEPASAAGAPGIEITLDRLGLKKGKIRFQDRTLAPPSTTEIDDIIADVRGVRFPDLTLKQVKLALSTPEQGEINVAGTLARDSGKVELEVRDVTLPPFNPYMAHFSPYDILSGGLSLSTKVTRSGPEYDITNAITLHDFDLDKRREGESFVEGLVGLPMSSILALLRDPFGNIQLNVPVEFSEKGTSIDARAIATNALRVALIGALASPLKLVGFVAGGFGKAGPLVPGPISFQLGRAELSKEGTKAVDGLVKLMKERPAVGVELETAATPRDARWLREQALLRKWDEEGFFGGLLALTRRGTRTRVREALAERAAGGTGELSPEDAQALEQWLDEIPETTPEQLQDLAARRLAAVAERLQAAQIEDKRVVREEPGSELDESATPAVKVRLRPVKAMTAAESQTH
jgi:hypothetical protein